MPARRPSASAKRVQELEAHILHLGRQITNWPKRFHDMLEKQTEAVKKAMADPISILVSQQMALERRIRAIEDREHVRDGVAIAPGNGTGGP